MAKVTGFIDADGHVVEADSELLEFLPAPFKGRDDLMAFPFFPTAGKTPPTKPNSVTARRSSFTAAEISCRGSSAMPFKRFSDLVKFS